MLAFYGNEVELFAICEKCGSKWEVVGEKFNEIKNLPMNIRFIPEGVCFGVNSPICDCE